MKMMKFLLFLLKSDFDDSDKDFEMNENVVETIIQLMKKHDEETREGLLFIPEQKCRTELKITLERFNQAVEHGMEEKLFG